MDDWHAEIHEVASRVVEQLTSGNKSLATAESCTGGWIAKAITDISGSSACFGYGIVSYANGAKESLLGVNASTLERHGAVSEAVVMEMAEGALALSGADIAVAVSGVAGPDGGSVEKPVGTVCFAWATRGEKADAQTQALASADSVSREQIRAKAVLVALAGVAERIGSRD